MPRGPQVAILPRTPESRFFNGSNYTNISTDITIDIDIDIDVNIHMSFNNYKFHET